MKISHHCLIAGLLSTTLAAASFTVRAAEEKPVGITPDISEVQVGDDVIKRNPDNDNVVKPAFAKTSRACPPFCIQPSTLAPGVETIGEVELIDYAKRMAEGDDSIVVIDSRTPDWVERGTIPGAINVPWTELNPASTTLPSPKACLISATARLPSCSVMECGAASRQITSRI